MELKTTTNNTWTSTQVLALAVFSLLLGVSGGWLIHRSQAKLVLAPKVTITAPAGATSQPIPGELLSTGAPPSAQQLKQAADAQAVPLLEQLKADPANAEVLSKLGNIYYDAKQYPEAIDFYKRSLKSRPSDASVHTDLGTAYWYSGNVETAIAEFNKALAYEPAKADTLFNLGIVKWHGTKDVQGAVAAWRKLLAVHPDYQEKETVLKLIAQAQSQ